MKDKIDSFKDYIQSLNKTKKISLSIILILLLIYLGGVIYFKNHVLPNTFLNGRNISNKKITQINNENFKKIKVIGKDNKTVEIDPEEIDFKVKDTSKIEIKQNPFIWPVDMLKTKEYSSEIETEYDKDSLKKMLLESELFKDIEEPENAKLEKQDSNYIIVEEKEGTALDIDELISSIELGIVSNQDNIKLKEEYKKPEILKDDENLIYNKDILDNALKTEIVFDFKDREEILTGDSLIDLYKLDSEGKYILDKQKTRDYVKNMAIKYDTFGAKRKFNATSIGEIEVEGGIYGWQMNVDKTRDLLIDEIEQLKDKKDKKVVIEPIYIHEALYREENDIGNTYIEIDLTRQHMWYYRDGELKVSTDVVTGDTTKGYPTPTGVDKLWSKERNKILRGLNFGGSSSYAVKVNYWMPINWKDIGIHDTSYRNAYGGSIYRGNGSHGCINTPESKVKEIFDDAPINIPVIVYKS